MRIFLSIVLFFVSHQLFSQYVLVWSDEFSGNSLDGSKWSHETGGAGWGNNESQFYTTNSTNSSVSNGELTITARQEQIGNNPYTSARIFTKGKMTVKYGKIEARLKVPLGQGLWPAFWMLGANIDAVSWPACGEIDIMEHVNNDTTIHGTAHWDNSGHAYYGTQITTTPAEYHIYTVQWDSTKIQWFLDGDVFFTMNIANGINGTSEFHNDFFLLLNLAVGGNWPGYPDATTTFPAEYKIDYVRVYKDQSELGVDEIEAHEISVFPIPAESILQISNLPFGVHNRISVIDLMGKVCLSTETSTQDVQLNISTLESGVFFIEYVGANGNLNRVKFIKQ